MKKQLVPQSIPNSTALTIPTPVALSFLGISELIQGMELPNVIGFNVTKKKKTTEKFTIGKRIFFAKINKALHLFLKAQNTANQYNKY